MLADDRSRKIAFVSDGVGTSLHTINAVSAIGLSSCFLYAVLAARWPKRSPLPPSVDYLLTIFPFLLSLTVFSAHPWTFTLSVALVALLFRLVPLSKSTNNASSPPDPPSTSQSSPSLPWLTTYRAHMMAITCLAILAVDFPIFPRGFGKTELWGTSLMDVGVGSFVFSLGMVSSRPFSALPDKQLPFFQRLYRASLKTLPTLALGFVRLAMVKQSGYPEHETEYGVHWNFFFTLAFLPPLGALVRPLARRLSPLLLGLSISIVHQLALDNGLQDWTLTTLRVGIISKNKEGIVSFPGYLSVYLLGIDVGARIFFSARSTSKSRNAIAIKLAILTACSWSAMMGADHLWTEGVSRRLANFPYVMWTTAFNTSFLLGYLLVDAASPSTSSPSSVPPLLEIANKHALLVFLLANLLTGLINVSISTIDQGSAEAVGILLVYSAFLYGTVWMYHQTR